MSEFMSFMIRKRKSVVYIIFHYSSNLITSHEIIHVFIDDENVYLVFITK